MSFYRVIFLFFVCVMLFAAGIAVAEEAASEPAEVKPAFRSTEFPLPRFVSLRSDKVYVRAGPGARYPIKWVYQKRNLPVEIILEFDNWRKIRDIDGEEGWVHQSLLSGKRTVLIQAQEMVSVRRKPGADERLVAYLEPQVVATLEACEEAWCKLDAAGYEGWVERQYIWGVYPKENL